MEPATKFTSCTVVSPNLLSDGTASFMCLGILWLSNFPACVAVTLSKEQMCYHFPSSDHAR